MRATKFVTQPSRPIGDWLGGRHGGEGQVEEGNVWRAHPCRRHQGARRFELCNLRAAGFLGLVACLVEKRVVLRLTGRGGQAGDTCFEFFVIDGTVAIGIKRATQQTATSTSARREANLPLQNRMFPPRYVLLLAAPLQPHCSAGALRMPHAYCGQ